MMIKKNVFFRWSGCLFNWPICELLEHFWRMLCILRILPIRVVTWNRCDVASLILRSSLYHVYVSFVCASFRGGAGVVFQLGDASEANGELCR